MRPCATGVVRSVHPVAGREIGANDPGAGTDVDDVGRRGCDGDRADRAGRFAVEERLPVVAVVARAPRSAVIETDVEERRTAGSRSHGAPAAGPERTDRAPAEGRAEVGSLGAGARGTQRRKAKSYKECAHGRSMQQIHFGRERGKSMNAQHTIALILVCSATFAFKQAGAQARELPLDRLTPGDVGALVDSSIAKASVYRDSLLAVRGRRTVRNTLGLYDEMSIAFNTGQIVALLSNVHPDSAVRAAAAAGARRRSAFSTALRLDPRLYRALLAVDTSQADAETRYYVARVLALYRHDGVDRDSSTRARIAALRDEAVPLEQRFNGIFAADNAPVLLADTTALGGLPGDWLKAQRRGPAGEIAVTPEDLRFVLQNSEDAAVRRQVMLRLQNRGAPGNHFVVDTLLRVRSQLATLLGYPSYAAYQFENHMAESPERVWRFLDDLLRITEPAVQRDVARAESLLGRPPQAGDFQFLVYHMRGRATPRPNPPRPYLPFERLRAPPFPLP